MRKFIIALLVALALPVAGNSQVCNIEVWPTDTLVCPGDSVLISSISSITSTGQQFNFNFGTLPPGWSTSGGSTFTVQPCQVPVDGTPYYWASTAGSGTPQINSPNFDVSCGGFINFDMVYAQQGGGSPCEGPDEQDEGVELQYSIDNGVTWITIVYYSPGGFELPSNPGGNTSIANGPTPYTTWNSFSVPLPPGAMTTSTQFQWIQQNSSGTCCDNWGIDNIVVAAGPCNSAWVDWNNDGIEDSDTFWYSVPADTFFVFDVYDSLGNYACSSDTIFITMYQNTMTYDLVDTVYAYCPYDTIPVEVLNLQNAPGPFSYSWSNGDITAQSEIGADGDQQDVIWQYVDVTDGCGFVRSDSVVMIVNQTLAIDTIITQNATACTPTGWASAQVSGLTTTQGQPFYNWTGPGNPGPFNVDGTAITNVPSGWYYFTVEDDVCEAIDSVFIGINEPPVAQFTPTNASGCTPVVVNFTNTSQNTTNYVWNFGDGTPNSTAVDVSHEFTQSATVLLIASDNSGCSDTAYAQIEVIPCGCTDPLATNYNPFASIDDGSCIYPFPTVVAPNVFTPDGDGVNDFFVLDATNTQEITLVITNRWGNVMYEGKGVNPAWDGRSQGDQDAEEGVYFYRYEAVGIIPENVVEGHGFLHLARPN